MDAFKLNIDGKDILLYRCTYAPVKSNMFIIIRGKDAIVIDPNDNPEGLKLLKDRGVEVIHILLTHEHFDHTVGVPVLQQAFPQNDLFCQEEAEKYISSKRGNNPMLIAFVLAEQDKKDGGDRYKQFKTYCPNSIHPLPPLCPGVCMKWNFTPHTTLSADSPYVVSA